MTCIFNSYNITIYPHRFRHKVNFRERKKILGSVELIFINKFEYLGIRKIKNVWF